MIEPWAFLPIAAGLAWLGSRGPAGATRSLGPAVAGRWYPASPTGLRTQVDELLGAVPAPAGAADVVALLAPHAGFTFSGQVAAHSFRVLTGARFDRVIVVGPSHYVGFRGAAVPDADDYRTPLGPVALDLPALDLLRARPGFTTENGTFRPEHSLEAEIPFLQRALAPGWKLVPVLVGGGSSGTAAAEIADGLRPLLGPGTLTVVSSDFTHFGHGFGFVPFREDVPEKLRELDFGAVRTIEGGDVAAFEEYVARTGATICGRDAVSVLLRLLPPGCRCEVAAYDTSGRMTGDWSHTVSYVSLVFRGAGAGERG